jgi:selenide,water dikinase
VIAGHYTRDQAEINVASLCTRSGVRFVAAAVLRVDADANCVHTPNGVVEYDVLSINTGSQPTMVPISGGHHVGVKPFSHFLDTFAAFDQKSNVVVVGGGAASVEVLLALAHRARAQGRACAFTLVSASTELIPGYPPSVRNAVRNAFRTYGANVRLGVSVVHGDAHGVRLDTGEHIACDASLWATRASPSGFIAASAMQRAADGFILVDGYQRSVSHANVFAVGDCATRGENALPKAGVVPVKQGPWLVDALASCAVGTQPPLPFVFQKNALALLALGDKRAAGARGAFTFSGAWVWLWKDWIDRRFMRKYS